MLRTISLNKDTWVNIFLPSSCYKFNTQGYNQPVALKRKPKQLGWLKMKSRQFEGGLPC